MNEYGKLLFYFIAVNVLGSILAYVVLKAFLRIKNPEVRKMRFIFSGMSFLNLVFIAILYFREKDFVFTDAISLLFLNAMFLTFYLLRKSKYFTKDLKELVGKSKK